MRPTVTSPCVFGFYGIVLGDGRNSAPYNLHGGAWRASRATRADKYLSTDVMCKMLAAISGKPVDADPSLGPPPMQGKGPDHGQERGQGQENDGDALSRVANTVADIFLSPFIDFVEWFARFVWDIQPYPSSNNSQKGPALKRINHLLETLLLGQGRFAKREPRERNTPLLFLVVCVHIFIVVALISYPYLTAPSRRDIAILGITALISVHWLVFKGECILSYWEKSIYYKDYQMGVAPLHHWFVDAVDTKIAIVIAILFVVLMTTSMAILVLRNFQMDFSYRPCGIVTRGKFADLPMWNINLSGTQCSWSIA